MSQVVYFSLVLREPDETKTKYSTPVTVHRISYTVICSYFFNNGKLHVILNKLHKLSTDEYSGEGTAKMLINTLCETLGVSESQLSKILKHLIYDGVYADVEERVAGGGCLELKVSKFQNEFIKSFFHPKYEPKL